MLVSSRAGIFFGIGVMVFLLSSCVVDGHLFFTNDTLHQYSTCMNQSVQPQVYNELMRSCYASINDDGSCSYDYAYFRCKSLMTKYSECADEEQLRKEYVEGCMNEN